MNKIITSDDDGHWYLINIDKDKDFNRFLEEGNLDEHLGEDWIKEIDYPESIIIKDYEVKN